MKRVVECLALVLAIALMTAAVLTYLAPHLGWRVDVVCSGSMEPELRVGSLAVTRPIESQDILVGDIITFNPRGVTLGENLVSHRVIGIGRNSPLYFETKGDANDKADPFIVPARNLVGKVCFHTPYAGYVTAFLRTPWGFLLALVIPGLIVIAMYIRSIQRMLCSDKKAISSKVVKG